MSERNRNWGKQSQQDWNRNKDRYRRTSDPDRDYYSETGYASIEQRRNQRMRDQFNEDRYDGGASNYRNDYNRNRQSQQTGPGHRQTNWGNQYGSEYNTGYGNAYNRPGYGMQGQYSESVYGSEHPGYRRNYRSGDYGANSGYLGGQGGYHPYENDSNYENVNRNEDERDWWDRTRDEVSSWFGDEDAERRRRADRQYAGYHRGKGPKGYTRSDQRIQEDVCDRLSDDDRLDATNIEVKVAEGEVILTGSVNDREQKRRAEDLVERISGVRDVENHIKVKREDQDTYSSIR
jgi:osmotically-inducible protein OsmY